MIPRLHPKGHSFKGAAAYLLHDKEADTANRVAWAETRNLATENPHAAWRVMAATAYNQEQLKARAGVKNTGRKSDAHVLHLSLSWSVEEAGSVTREEMLQTADSALRALGAGDRQVIIVSHNDEPHPHVHILLNRVSPVDGRILPSSKEKLALSRWAEAYERGRGQIFCEERVINNAARDRRQYTRARDDSRITYEERDQAANDNREPRRRRVSGLAARRRELATRQQAAWRSLEGAHRERKAKIAAQAKQRLFAEERAIRERYRPEWTALFRRQQQALREHEGKEKHLLGRAENVFRSIDFGAIVRGTDRRRAIAQAFRAITSRGVRAQELRHEHRTEARVLALRQQREERAAARSTAADRHAALAKSSERFLGEREALTQVQERERMAARRQWHSVRLARPVARPVDTRRGMPETTPAVTESFNRAAGSEGGKRSEDARQRDLLALNAKALKQADQAQGRAKDRQDRER